MIMSMVTAMMMMLRDHEYDDDDYDNDIRVGYFFIPRRPLMQEVSNSFICVTVGKGAV